MEIHHTWRINCGPGKINPITQLCLLQDSCQLPESELFTIVHPFTSCIFPTHLQDHSQSVCFHTCRVDHLEVEVLGHSAPDCDGQFFEGLRLQNVVLRGSRSEVFSLLPMGLATDCVFVAFFSCLAGNVMLFLKTLEVKIVLKFGLVFISKIVLPTQHDQSLV